MLAATLTVLVMVATGMVLYRRLAHLLLAGATPMLESELLLLGILPAMALVGGVATYLSIFHLLRLWVLLPLAAAIFIILRRDALALLGGVGVAARQIAAAVRRGDLFPAFAMIASIFVLALGCRLSQIPSPNVDVWVFHIPLAQSFGAHAGFAIPQISNRHYASQPLLLELLSGTAMLAVPGDQAPDAVNIVIFFGFLLMLLPFARRAKGFQLLVIFYIFCWMQAFLRDAAEPMIDLPRSCLSVGALLFAYRYALSFNRYDLTMSALLAGAAVAGKYTELVTPAIIAVSLAPLMLRRRQTWTHLIPAAIAFTLMAAVWYVKNWIFNGNPIYPFLFGHPGLSDAWVKDYMQEMTRPFDPADRTYSTKLTTLKGWHDFFIVMTTKFDYLFAFDYAGYLLSPALLVLLGFFLRRPRYWFLPLWSLLLFLLWYAVMFNALRWSVPAVMTTFCAVFISWAWMVDLALDRPEIANIAHGERLLPLAASASFLLYCAVGLRQFGAGHGGFILPRWMNRDMAVDMVSPGGMERFLNRSQQGYEIYHYIGQHNLAHVFQPFDNGASFYASVYNGGHSNDWIVAFTQLPGDLAHVDQFLKKNDIHYFIQTAHLSPVIVQRLGPDHVALANAIMDSQMPHSRLLLRDGQGLSLYQILPDPASGNMR